MKRDKGLDLIAMSLDYPELNMVKYDGVNNVIIFELAAHNEEAELQDNFISQLKKCLELYYKLNMIKPDTVHIEVKNNTNISFIRLHRDIKTVDSEELKLFIHVAHNYWGNCLIKDDCQYESLINKNSWRRNLIDQIGKEISRNSSYLVYRQHGKVVVHNR